MASEFSPSSVAQNTDALLQQAIALHQGGKWQLAEQLYATILRHQPDHSLANHNRGVLDVQRRQPELALPYFVAAINAEPARAHYWLSYVDALLQAEKPEEAQEVLELAKLHGLEGERANELTARFDGEGQSVQPSASANHDGEPSQSDIDTLMSLFAQGQFSKVIPIAQALTERYPRHGVGWKALGVLYMQLGQSSNALVPMQKAAALSPDDAEAHNNLGIALYELGRLGEAEASYRRALQICPSDAGVHSNLGAALQKSRRLGEAEACYRHALKIRPDYAKALSNLGSILQESGRLVEAEACYRRALKSQPGNAATHQNLSITLKETGRLDEAEKSCRNALQIKPDFVDAHYHMANLFYDLNRFEEAEASYRQALQLDPKFPGALNNLALLYKAQGNATMALNSVRRSLQVNETPEAKSIFVSCAQHLNFTHDDTEMRHLLVRALTEPWGRPSELASVCINLIKCNPDVGACLLRAAEAWPRRLEAQDLYGSDGRIAVAADGLLRALLESSPICDIGLERFLTTARHAMLDDAIDTAAADGEAMLEFYAALARQNFVNEYVLSCTDDEVRKVDELRDRLLAALESGAHIPALWPVKIAAYLPLYSISLPARLFERPWPEAVMELLIQQIREPLEERELRAGIPKLTEIDDDVSLQVQDQYEANPYPRWVKLAPVGAASDIVEYLCRKFPLARFDRGPKGDSVDVLIAGCGTGSQPIGSGLRTRGAKVLAIDLSMSSLGYAKRKTRELGLNMIDYAQADILKLDSLGRRFDVIESSGVLHHLADPWQGWQTLVSLLRPGGFMKIGLYSEIARSDVVRIRDLIAEKGYDATDSEIRRCRQDLAGMDADFGAILSSPDFFSTSACRDLLFHVHEHRMNLAEIGAFLGENELSFLGFEIDINVLHAYKVRFPEDRAATDLRQWQVFENENPDTFANMYQFWIQKL